VIHEFAIKDLFDNKPFIQATIIVQFQQTLLDTILSALLCSEVYDIEVHGRVEVQTLFK
jgi:hypothetical protein